MVENNSELQKEIARRKRDSNKYLNTGVRKYKEGVDKYFEGSFKHQKIGKWVEVHSEKLIEESITNLEYISKRNFN